MTREKLDTTREEKIVMAQWDRSRQYLDSENRLIHERIGRTLVIHGFLLTSYVLVCKLLIESELILGAALILKGVIFLIACVGFRTSESLQIGIYAAFDAIESVEQNWELLIKEYGSFRHLYLPGLSGGGCKKARDNGTKSVKIISHTLFLFWLFVLVASVPLVILVKGNIAV